MLEQLNEEMEDLQTLKTEIEAKQERLYGPKVDSDMEYQKGLAQVNIDEKEEVIAFSGEFGDLLLGFKWEIFADANENNEERVVAETTFELNSLKQEIVA